MKKKMLLEAQKRLGILLDMGLKDEVTNVFEEHSLEYLTKETTLLGVGIINFSFDDADDLKNVKELFEEQYDCLVYYGILTSTSIGQLISFFYVSHNEEEWEDDVKELKEGYPFVYVWNREEEFGEFGSIQIKMEQGAMVRVA